MIRLSIQFLVLLAFIISVQAAAVNAPDCCSDADCSDQLNCQCQCQLVIAPPADTDMTLMSLPACPFVDRQTISMQSREHPGIDRPPRIIA